LVTSVHHGEKGSPKGFYLRLDFVDTGDDLVDGERILRCRHRPHSDLGLVERRCRRNRTHRSAPDPWIRGRSRGGAAGRLSAEGTIRFQPDGIP
jgi:hypothetical protein